jgi:hypothetical protein
MVSSYSDLLDQILHFGAVFIAEALQKLDDNIPKAGWVRVEVIVESVTLSFDDQAKKTSGTHFVKFVLMRQMKEKRELVYGEENRLNVKREKGTMNEAECFMNAIDARRNVTC